MCYGTRFCALFDSPFLLQKEKSNSITVDDLSKKIISFEYEVFVFVVRVLSLSVCVKSFEFPAVKFNSHHASSLCCTLWLMAADGKKMKSVQSSIWADCKMCKLVVIVLCLGSLPHISNGQTELENLPSSACYNAQGNAQRCMPVFVNAAFSKTVEATNTCGLTRPTEYCLQTGVTGVRKQCQICDAKRPGYSHPPEYMSDFNNNHNWTWWQSDTMLEGIQYPVVVNLTLNLSKYAYQREKKKNPQKFM